MPLSGVSRRKVLKGLGIIAASTLVSPYSNLVKSASAGPACPQVAGKTIRWIVPFSAGGGYDTYSRLIATFYAAKLGAKICVENIRGGGGLLGAHQIKQAAPDGLTMGMVDAPGLLAASLVGAANSLNLLAVFTILARVEGIRLVWVTRADSPLKSIDDLFSLASQRPILFGVTDVANTNFIDIAVTTNLLGLPAQYVAGYPGTRQTTLAAMRGEVDLVSVPYESAHDRIENGGLRVLLRIASEQRSPNPSLDKVPILGSKGGLAALRSTALGRSPQEAVADAQALISLMQSGRLVVAPRGLERGLSRCLEGNLCKTLADPAFLKTAAAAQRPLDVATSQEARQLILSAMAGARKLTPVIKAAIRQVRS